MKRGDTIKMANSTKQETKKDRNYEQVKQSIININRDVILKQTEVRSELFVAVQVLRDEKKDRKAITEQLKNDFVNTGILGKTLVYDVVKEAFASEAELEQIKQQKEQALAKRRQIIAANTSGQSVTQEEEGDDGNEDFSSIRENAKKNMLTKNVRKGSAQMQKMNPDVIGKTELEGDEDEDIDLTNTVNFDDDDDTGTLQEHGNTIVIDDPEHLEEIGKLINSKKAVVILVNKNLVPEGIKEGKSLT